MKFYLTALGISALCTLAACQYTATPPAVGAFNVYSSYENKLPGRYLLYVDGSALNATVKPSDLNCAAHSFPHDLTSSFTSSTQQTIANLVQELELVPAPVDRSELAAMKARGMIIVRGEQTIARLRVVPGFWSAGIESDVEIIASITVDGRLGRLLGSTVSGRGAAQSDAGVMCDGGASSLSQSAGDAMRQTLTRIGEALTNSERVRSGAGG